MSWQISAGSTTVTFPVNPQSIVDENPVVETDFQVDGQQSVVVSEGLDVRTLTLKGFFYVSGQNQSYLDTNFCNPLLSLNGKEVTLTSPISRYNGTWVLIVKSLEQKAEGNLQRYTYTLMFKQGAAFVVL
ncbi:MAG TPA: hypothetical protein VK536_05535 [Candidatus Limnocylindrales bacterium]|nr:hypothetical protein [Candidatus Limnocylindrales bacterium]